MLPVCRMIKCLVFFFYFSVNRPCDDLYTIIYKAISCNTHKTTFVHEYPLCAVNVFFSFQYLVHIRIITIKL